MFSCSSIAVNPPEGLPFGCFCNHGLFGSYSKSSKSDGCVYLLLDLGNVSVGDGRPNRPHSCRSPSRLLGESPTDLERTSRQST